MSLHTKLRLTLVALALSSSIGTVAAADFTFNGNIQNHNDVIRINFTLTHDATNVKVWTDSFNSGANFDPITAVWQLPSGNKVGENDDNPGVAPGQTFWDSGLTNTHSLAWQ